MNSARPKGKQVKTGDLLPHTDFDSAFTPGTVFLNGEREYKMETAKRGMLVVSSGRIVANDVLAVLWRAKPFKRSVPPGKYLVTIAWNGSETCAMLVRFSRRKVARWEPATRIGEKRKATEEYNPPCFGVDSGMAGFFDAKAAKIAGADENWNERFDTSQYAIEIDPHSGAGVVWCFSGYGDGAYPCYWGLDRSENVACLVADFLVLVEGVYEEHVITDLHEKIGTEWADPWFARVGCSDVQLKWKSKKRNEIQFEYRCESDRLDVQLVNGKGKVVYGGVSGGRDHLGFRFMSRVFDVNKDKKAKLVIKRFVGVRALPKKA